jgi:hypothetical protein
LSCSVVLRFSVSFLFLFSSRSEGAENIIQMIEQNFCFSHNRLLLQITEYYEVYIWND